MHISRKMLPRVAARFPNIIRPYKFTVITAYDFASGRLASEAGMAAILVGDSLAMTQHGFKSTKYATMNMMATATLAVRRGAPYSHIISDLPFESDCRPKKALRSGKRLIECGADSVKVEGPKYESIQALARAKIPVLGHLGCCPQTATSFKKTGKSDEESKELIDSAKRVQEAGAIALVLENVCEKTVEKIQEVITIPTIGIYSGTLTDGQVLVWNDLMGLTRKEECKKGSEQACVNCDELMSHALMKYRISVEKGLV